MAGHRGPDGREDGGVSFSKSEGSYLWMTNQINVYLVPFYLFFFLPPNIEGLRVCKQLVQHSLFTTGKARLLASDLLLLLRHILGRLRRLASASWSR